MYTRSRGLLALYLSHPRGAYLLCFTATLERFSFYTMSGLLVRFLTGSLASGGLGWAADSAIRYYGTYVDVLWLMPLAGGWAVEAWIATFSASRSLQRGFHR